MRSFFRTPMADHHLIAFSAGILTAIGTMMVLSSSAVIALSKGDSPYYFVIRQLLFLAVALVVTIPISRMNPDWLRRVANFAFLLSFVGLALVQTPLGFEIYGNRNWIRIGSLLTIQPSEFAKLGMVVWGAAVLHNRRRNLHEPLKLTIPFVPGALVLLLLILVGKDLGTGLVFGALVFAILFFVGAPLRLLGPSLIAVAGVVVLLILGSPSRLARFSIYANPQANPDLASQPLAAVYALASGGWWGLGLGASKQKWGGLKEGAHTDFVFAVLGEELGLVGVVLVLLLFGLLARSGYRVALQSASMFNRIVAAGITTWFLIQALVNIMVVMHMLPVLGVPLPFISSGGSALMANLLAVGVLLCVARDTPQARAYLASRKRAAGPRMTSVLAVGAEK